MSSVPDVYPARIAYPSVEQVHNFWRVPDADNQPHTYVDGAECSELLLDLVGKNAASDSRILEIGCNVGRNLNHLFQAGYNNLSAIEINDEAIALLIKTFPDLASRVTLFVGPIERVIREFEDDTFDLVYSMAVLEHVHYESNWVLAEISRIARKTIITIEDETGLSTLTFPRNYQKAFEPLGWKQRAASDCSTVFLGSETNECDSTFTARVMQKL